MELGVGHRARVLLSDLRAELDVRTYRFAERGIVGQARLIERLEIQRDETLPLFVGDLQAAVRADNVLESQLPREPIGPAERLRGEPRPVIDVTRSPLREERRQDGSPRTLS